MTELAAAADELGVLGMPELQRAGLGPRELRRLVSSGALTHLSRGWYAVGPLPDSPEAAHLVRLRALERAYAGTATASHHSELLRLGLPAFGADLREVHLVRTQQDRQQRRRPGVAVHRPVSTEALDRAGRVHPALAIVQHGLTGPAVGALCAADAALRAELVTREDLTQAIGWIRRHPRSALLAGFIMLADARSAKVTIRSRWSSTVSDPWRRRIGPPDPARRGAAQRGPKARHTSRKRELASVSPMVTRTPSSP
jgi:hypothetical protein